MRFTNKGFSRQLEDEVFSSCFKIYSKYIKLKKPELTKYDILAIMYAGMISAIQHYEKQNGQKLTNGG